VLDLAQDHNKLRALVKSILWLAAAVSLAMLAQFALGDALPFLPGRVEKLWTYGQEFSDITRVMPPGQSLVVCGFILSLILWITSAPGRNRLIYLSLFGLCTLGLLLTFSRNYWVAALLATGLLILLIRGESRLRLIQTGIVLLVGFLLLFLFSYYARDTAIGRMFNASLERLTTLGRVETYGSTLERWRYVENGYAAPKIASNLWLGIGLGARYRPYDGRIDTPQMQWQSRRYIHNAHFWILLASGLPGYVCFMTFLIAGALRGLIYRPRISDPLMNACVLANSLTILGLIAAALVNPIFMQPFWVHVLGIMVGINESQIIRYPSGQDLAIHRDQPVAAADFSSTL
jgi:hypothetical protein